MTRISQRPPLWSRAVAELDIRIERAIHKIIVSPTTEWLLVSGGSIGEVRRVSYGMIVSRIPCPENSHRAVQSHSLSSDRFVAIRNEFTHLQQ